MINLFVWSGPRNISTALMRSFENRKDTKLKHPQIELILHKKKAPKQGGPVHRT